MNQILAGHLNFEGGIKQGETASLPLSRGNTLCLSNKHISVCTQTDSSIGYSDLMFRVFKSAWKDSLYGEEIGIFFSFLFFCFFFCANLAILLFLVCISLLDYLLAVEKWQLSLELMFWIPMFTPQVVNLIRDLDTDFSILGKNYINVIQVSSHLFAMSSACYNPFIYASLHNKFLSYLCLHFLPWRKGKAKDRRQGSSVLTVSHRMPRLYTSTIAADLPGVDANNADPQENYT